MGGLSDFEKHVFRRLDNLEAELDELREVTWPVCQGQLDKRSGVFVTLREKRKFFYFLDNDLARRLLRLKARFMGEPSSLVDEELRQIRIVS